MEAWVVDFDSWDLCDQVCGNLFTETPHSFDRAREWVRRDEEFVKRAGFSIVAEQAARTRDDRRASELRVEAMDLSDGVG